MAEEIRDLIEKINQEGIRAAEEKAQNIEAAAQQRADEILAQAKLEAEEMISAAEKEFTVKTRREKPFLLSRKRSAYRSEKRN